MIELVLAKTRRRLRIEGLKSLTEASMDCNGGNPIIVIQNQITSTNRDKKKKKAVDFFAYQNYIIKKKKTYWLIYFHFR